MASLKGKDMAMAKQMKRFDVIVKRPENQECFECTSKQPRWASTNLGVIFCLRCAGVHRGLGVHISKVKSTKMDLWDEDMIVTVDKIGNGGGKLLYEANLPHGFQKPTENTDTKEIERILINKYDRKRWIAADFDVIRASLMDAPTESGLSSVASPASVSADGNRVIRPDLSGLGGQTSSTNSNNTTNATDWGDFTSSPAMPATPSNTPMLAGGGTGPTGSTSTPAGGDFWSTFGSANSEPQQQAISSPFGGPISSSNTTTGTVQSSTTASVPSLMEFGTTTNNAGVNSGQRRQETSSIMNAFNHVPATGHQGALHQQQQQSWGQAPNTPFGGMGSAQSSSASPSSMQPQHGMSNGSEGQWSNYTQSPVTPVQQGAVGGANSSPSLMDFGAPQTGSTQQPSAAQGSYQRSGNTKDIMDMFSSSPATGAGAPVQHGGGGMYQANRAPTNSVWGQGTAQQQQQPASFF